MFMNFDGTRRKLVIFGMGTVAKLAYHYFTIDSEYDVCALCVDEDHGGEATFCSLPVVGFESVVQLYPPEDHEMFIALGYQNINALRKEKYFAAQAKGYRLASYLSSRAMVMNQGVIGDNCFIMENVTLQPEVTIGNNVIIWSGCTIAHGSTIHDHSFLASGSVVAGEVTLGEECFVGLNAIIRDRLHIGARCLIGAGSIVLEDAEPEGVYGSIATVRADFSSSTAMKFIHI